MGTLYHNPRCSKSRQTLVLVENSKAEFKLVEYLKTPLDEIQILDLISRLQTDASTLVRVQDADFQGTEVDVNTLGDPQVVASLLASNPRLMQRPVYDNGTVAVITRPPELISSLL
ncbi:MAG: ArsC/Spx/MgsR family protein [Candidatus Poseidoniaceae archaeon]|nr:ArsC/Spx/MgsR family protein [Candidatus Poseidoniaceae archaeon]MDP7203068.1 ArsC/Spx/MgsR family protein [Candidatus Poseidoniaceae archaeon]